MFMANPGNEINIFYLLKKPFNNVLGYYMHTEFNQYFITDNLKSLRYKSSL